MESRNVTKTKELGLCVSCEICAAVCPVGAIIMDYEGGQFVPNVDEGGCTDCGLCLQLCPGIDIDPSGLRYRDVSNDMFDGHCLASYVAHSNKREIRENSTSGGVITDLIAELIRNNKFDAAFVLHFDSFHGKPARLKATTDISEILSAAKSKYIPASVYNVIAALKEHDNRKYVVVSTPCQLCGIRKFMAKHKVPEDRLLFLGLFCDKTLSFNAIRYFEARYARRNERLTRFEFRTKEEYGWPGNCKAYFDSGREVLVDRRVRIGVKRFFQLNRCLLCLDKLNRLADISFGDCYIKGKGDIAGKSSVMVRTEKGKAIFDEYSYLFTLESVNVRALTRSQQLRHKLGSLDYAKIYIKEHGIYPGAIPNYTTSGSAAKRLLTLNRHIEWGRNCDFNKIRFLAFATRIARKLDTAGKLLKVAALLGTTIIRDTFSQKQRRDVNERRESQGNIIIIGGNLFNKGAQAMTFATVDQLKRRLPKKNIYLFSKRDFDRDDDEKSRYNFNILPWHVDIVLELLGFSGYIFGGEVYSEYLAELRAVIRNADFFIDISGYALSGQWGFLHSGTYILNILIAKKYSVPYYIFPQSIGPFDYPILQKLVLSPLMKLYLQYPERIFVREEQGVNCVRQFRRKGVERKHDIVLQSGQYNTANFFRKPRYPEEVRVEPNSVGIIPNSRVFERAAPDKLYAMYGSLMSHLVAANRTVYILRHSHEDLELCQTIRDSFSAPTAVKLMSDDLQATELEDVIRQFDCVIASRYHAIIHSYKNGVPALVIGWATKYFELLKDFDQLDYYFDVRSSLDLNQINTRLDQLLQRLACERAKITNKISDLADERIFDMFGKPSTVP